MLSGLALEPHHFQCILLKCRQSNSNQFRPGLEWLAAVSSTKAVVTTRWYDTREFSIKILKRGKTYLAVFRTHHTKNKLTTTHDNLFEFAYALKTTTMRPNYACFLDVLVAVVHMRQLWLYI